MLVNGIHFRDHNHGLADRKTSGCLVIPEDGFCALHQANKPHALMDISAYYDYGKHNKSPENSMI
jgi:hypothetical protein